MLLKASLLPGENKIFLGEKTNLEIQPFDKAYKFTNLVINLELLSKTITS